MKNSIRWFLLAGFLGCAACTLQPVVPQPTASRTVSAPVLVSGPAAAGQAWTAPAAGYDTGAYRINALDPITIQFTGMPEQQSLQVVVDENGQINLPHIGQVRAAGLTTSELEREIERLYKEGQIYRNVSINAIMTAKSFYVQGEVNAPGQFSLTAGTTLMQAIASARGVSPYASDRVTITRKSQSFRYNIGEIKRHPERDVKIEAGDLINVHRSWF